MNSNIDDLKAKDFEITFIDIIKVFFHNYLKIAVISLFFFIAAFLYFNFSEDNYSARLEISPQRSQDRLYYQDFNLFVMNYYLNFDTDQKNELINKNKLAIKEDVYQLKSSQLNENFFRIFLDYSLMVEAMNNHEYFSNFSLKEKYDYAKLFKISKVKTDYYDDSVSLNINFFSSRKNINVNEKLIDETLISINNKLKTDILKQINKLADSIENSHKLIVDKATLEIKTQKTYLTNKLKRKINELKESAQIARELEIEKPLTNMMQVELNTNKNALDARKISPSYLEGYLALEKEIELLLNRGEDDLLEETLINTFLQLERAKLYDPRVELDQIVELLPFNNDTFRVVDYNLNNLEYIKLGQNKLIMIFLITLLGFISSFLYFLFRDLYRKYL